MYPCTKFRSICKTSNFWTKFVQKYMNDQKFEKKTNINMVISTQQYTPVRIFSHFVELQTMGPKFPKNMTHKNFEKINIKIIISI